MLEFKNKDTWTRRNYTKTAAGKRIISLDDDTLEILKEWKAHQAKHCQSDFIFSYDGKPMHKSTIGRIISRYAKLARVHRVQAKGLRHSHCSMLANDGIDLLLLSKRLGHESITTTVRYYAHLYPNRDEEIAQRINGSIKFETFKAKKLKNI